MVLPSRRLKRKLLKPRRGERILSSISVLLPALLARHGAGSLVEIASAGPFCNSPDPAADGVGSLLCHPIQCCDGADAKLDLGTAPEILKPPRAANLHHRPLAQRHHHAARVACTRRAAEQPVDVPVLCAAPFPADRVVLPPVLQLAAAGPASDGQHGRWLGPPAGR